VKPPFIPNIKAAAAGGLLHEKFEHQQNITVFTLAGKLLSADDFEFS
jgi:hypothetical protein